MSFCRSEYHGPWEPAEAPLTRGSCFSKSRYLGSQAAPPTSDLGNGTVNNTNGEGNTTNV